MESFYWVVFLAIGIFAQFPSLSISKSLESKAEQEILSNLINEDLEEEAEGQVENPEELRKIPTTVRFPSYLEQLEEVSASDDEGLVTTVWFPVEIKERKLSMALDDKSRRNNVEGTEIVFQQNQPSSVFPGHFLKAQLVMTKKKKDETNTRGLNDDNDNGTLVLYQVIPIPGSTSSSEIDNNVPLQADIIDDKAASSKGLETNKDDEKFYELDVTGFLQSHLVQDEEKMDHPNQIKLQFLLLLTRPNNGTEMTLPVYEVFDMHVEAPFIIFSYQKEGQRQRRIPRSLEGTPGPTGRQQGSEFCQRVTWEVDPEIDINWHGVVRPRQFDLGFCTGSCPFPLQNDHYNFTFNAFFRDRYRLNKAYDIPKGFPKPCCVPISYKSTRIWVSYEENTLSQQVFHDLTVDKCGCR